MSFFSRLLQWLGPSPQADDPAAVARHLLQFSINRAKMVDETLRESPFPATAPRSDTYNAELLIFAVAPTDQCLADTPTPLAQEIRKHFQAAFTAHAQVRFPKLASSAQAWEQHVASRLTAYRRAVAAGDVNRLGDLAAGFMGLQDSPLAGLLLGGTYTQALNATLDVLQGSGIAP